MGNINCYEAQLNGMHFEFLKGIRIDEIFNNQMLINGLGTILYRNPLPIDSSASIEDVFSKEEDVWVGGIDDQVYIFNAGIIEDNLLIAPISADPKFIQTRYIKLICKKEDVVMVLGDGRILSRVYDGDNQNVFLALEKEAVVNVSSPGGITAMFENTAESFKIV